MSNPEAEPAILIRLGVCAMSKKAASKPMREILARITSFSEFEVIFFDEQARGRAWRGH